MKLTRTKWIIWFSVVGCVLLFISNCTKKEEPIIKKDPVITWTNPSDITYGTLLSATQLNATANITGTFVYTPVIGTKLNAGANQDLKVDFTPTDEATYNAASKTVKINVTQATGSGGICSVVFNTTKTYGTMTDQDGNVYKTITIGTQTWMAENLRVTKYRNGDPISNVSDNAAWAALTTGAYCNYANTTDKDKIATYGRLYNWFTVADSRNIAPTGWHVPTDAEWTLLTTYLGGESVAGGKMKEAGTTHWTSPNTGASNESGFSGTPAGDRNSSNGTFYDLGGKVYYWSSTQGPASNVWLRDLYYDYVDCILDRNVKGCGFSARLVRDL